LARSYPREMFFIGSTATFHVGKYFRGQLNCDHGVVSYSASSATPWYFVFVDKDGISLIFFYETPTAGHLTLRIRSPVGEMGGYDSVRRVIEHGQMAAWHLRTMILALKYVVQQCLRRYGLSTGLFRAHQQNK
jgi:hypothetical protein